MKTINISLDLSEIKIQGDVTTLTSIWKLYILNGVRTTYKDGSDGDLLYKIGKIISKIKDDSKEIELEDAEYVVLKEINERGKFDSTWYTFVPQIKQRIEEVK